MSAGAFRHWSPEEFLDLDPDTVTLVDLREPEDVSVYPLDGAIPLPFSRGFGDLDTIPKDKPVIVCCKFGSYSELVAEILLDRGYDVGHLDGGTLALQALDY